MNWKATGAIALTLMIAAPLGLGYILAVDDEETVAWETTKQSNISDLILNHETPYYGEYTGPANNSMLVGTIITSPEFVSVSSVITSTPRYTTSSDVLDIPKDSWTVMNESGPYSITSPMSLRLTVSSSTGPQIQEYTSSTIDVAANGLVRVRDTTGSLEVQEYTTILGVTQVEVKPTFSSPSVIDTILRYTPSTTQFGDASAGWRLPALANIWMNGQANNEVVMYIDLEQTPVVKFFGGSEFVDGDLNIGFSLITHSLEVSGKPGMVPTQELGNYTKVQVIFRENGATVSGLISWPSMGSPAQTLNSVEISYPAKNLVSIDIYDYMGTGAVFRVDSAQALQGYFPSTMDYTLNLSSLFPDSMMTVKLNSIGIYGDSLAIGSESFDVTDGRITVDGRKVPLKGAMISFLPDEDGTVTGRINGVEVGSFESIPSVTFGGEWSLTALAYKVEEVSETNLTWQPGGFGLDREGFAAVGLLTAGAVFVVLGMQGRMNSTKVGVLLMVCGGAAFAYFSFL